MKASLAVWAVLPAFGLFVEARAARADDVLVYARRDTLAAGLSGNPAAAEAEKVLTGLGHTVTVISADEPVLPADLSVFDSIWVLQLRPIQGGEQANLRAFVSAGGGLYVTGERGPCCNPLNESLNNLLVPLMVPPLPNFAVLQESGALLLPSPQDPFGITTTPNVITQWETEGAGVVGSAPPARVVFQSPTAQPVALALVGEDLDHAAGCVFVAMDLSFWLEFVAPAQDLAPLVENIQRFLVTCGDSDGDGLSDEGEAIFGTNPGNPDSDGDGLCDGYGAVEGLCVSGESPFHDFDNDDVSNPLDDDDDGDGIPTRFELEAERLAPDVDGDRIPAQHDFDSDGDFRLDNEEGPGDYDNDGIPAIVDQDDFPEECDVEGDCGALSGLYCNTEVGFCHPGCFAGSNGCPSGLICTSTNETKGECSGGRDGGAGGAGPGGAGPDSGGPGGSQGGAGRGSGGSQGGPDAGQTGGSSGGDAGGTDRGGSAEARDDGGCGCATAGTGRDAAVMAAPLAWLAWCARRRRRSARRRAS